MKKQEKKQEMISAADLRGISSRGKIIIGVGIGLLTLGFFILTKTNPQGDNWASVVSPILLIGGYITIALGIIS